MSRVGLCVMCVAPLSAVRAGVNSIFPNDVLIYIKAVIYNLALTVLS